MKTVRETPDHIAKQLVDIANDEFFKKYDSREFNEIYILEPSAGFGKIADAIKEKYIKAVEGYININCIELNTDLYAILESKGYNTVHKDFLQFNTDYFKRFNIIIACPPFKGNIDIKHIMHMYNMTDRKGVIVTLTSPYWLTNNEPLQVEFREFLSDKNYKLTMLPDNTFIEKGKTVPTAILTIIKK